MQAAETSTGQANGSYDYGTCPEALPPVRASLAGYHDRKMASLGNRFSPFLFNIYIYDLPPITLMKFANSDNLAILHSSGK